MTLAAAWLCGPRALAGPPFVTDDPEPVEYKHWEAYLFSIYNHPAGGDFAQAPAIEVNYGLFPEAQIHLIAPVTLNRDSDDPVHYGYGDTELGFKYRFFQETEFLPQVGTFPLVELPTGDADRGLGSGYTQVFVPIWLQKSFGPKKEGTSFGGGGFWYTPGDDHRNFWRVGVELQRDLNEQWTLGGEIYHETPSQSVLAPLPGLMGGHDLGGSASTRGHTAFNLGAYLNLDEHRHVLFSAGRDIDGPNHFSCYIAFQLTF